MPVSMLIPLGLAIVLVGVLLHFFSRYKLIARLLMLSGLAITVLMFIVIWLTVNSGM